MQFRVSGWIDKINNNGHDKYFTKKYLPNQKV